MHFSKMDMDMGHGAWTCPFFPYGFSYLKQESTKLWLGREIKPKPQQILEVLQHITLIKRKILTQDTQCKRIKVNNQKCMKPRDELGGGCLRSNKNLSWEM